MNAQARQMQEQFRRNEAVCGRVITLFQLVANKTRFRIVCLLTRGEFCVRDILEVLGEGKLSNLSQQLKILTLAGMIQRRREQQRVLYTLKDERLRGMIAYLQREFLTPDQP